jgi:ABC-type multidrug transport system fused ATPase/permease subunit
MSARFERDEQLRPGYEDELTQDDNRPLELDDSAEMNDLRKSPEDSVKLGWFEIAQVALIGLAQAVVIVATGLLVRAAIDALERSGFHSGPFLTLIWVLVAVVLIGGLVRGLEWAVSESIGFRYMHRVRMVMYTHLERIVGRRLLRISRGAVLLRFTGDLGLIRAWVSRGIARGIVGVMSVIAGLAVLFYFHPVLGLFALAVFGVTTIMSLRVGRWQRRAIRMVRRRRANLTTNLTEQIHGMSTVQALGRMAGEYDRLLRQSARLTRRLVRYSWIRGLLRAIATGASWLAVVGVLVISAYYYDAGLMTMGTIVAAVMVTRMMMRPVRGLGMANEYWQNGRVSRQKVLTFLRQPYREAGSVPLPALHVSKGLIEFRNVSLDGSLKGISAQVEPRRLVAVTGPNGAGKTSLLSVVARINDPTEGGGGSRRPGAQWLFAAFVRPTDLADGQ